MKIILLSIIIALAIVSTILPNNDFKPVGVAQAAMYNLPSERSINLSPGILGGIPENYTLCANVKNPPYNAVGDDSSDDTAAFQNALAVCSSGTYVYVPAGTYRITAGLTIPNGVLLKGDGPALSKLRDHRTAGTGAYLLQMLAVRFSLLA